MNLTTYKERAKVYDDAVRVFGNGNQLVVALEELAEVQKEICKVMRGEGSTLHLAEEVADATIMLEQIRRIFDINAEVCKVMDEKVARLAGRIADKRQRDEARMELLHKVFNTRKDDGHG